MRCMRGGLCGSLYAPGNKCVYYGRRRRCCPWMCATADCALLRAAVEARRGWQAARLGMASALRYNRNRTRTPLPALGRPFARFSSRYRKLRFRLRHSVWRGSVEVQAGLQRPTDRRRAQFGPLPHALTGLKLTSQTSSFSHLREKRSGGTPPTSVRASGKFADVEHLTSQTFSSTPTTTGPRPVSSDLLLLNSDEDLVPSHEGQCERRIVPGSLPLIVAVGAPPWSPAI